MATLQLPTTTVEVAFTTDPLATPTWTNITAYVESGSIDTGREREEGRAKTGTLTLKLKNNDRRFDPNHTGSPYHPNVVPGRRIRVRSTWAAVPHDLFTGFVEDWPQDYESSFSSTVTITCPDAFALFASMPLADSVWATEVMADAPTAWYRLGDTGGTVMADSSGNSRNGQYQHITATQDTMGVDGLIAGDDDKAFAPNRNTNPGGRGSVPNKNLISGYPFTVECWLRSGRDPTSAKYLFAAYNGPTSPSQVVSAHIANAGDVNANAGEIKFTITNGSTSRSAYSGLRQFLDDGAIHHVVIVATSSSSLAIWVDGINDSDSPATGTPTFPNDLITGYAIGNTPAVTFGDFSFATLPGDVLDEMIFYDGVALSSARIAAHHTAGRTAWEGQSTGTRIGATLDIKGWPAGDRDLDAGNATLVADNLANNVLEEIQTAADAEAGMLFVAGDGKVTLIERHAFLAAPYTTSQATFGDTDAELPYEDLTPDTPYRYIRNEISVTPTGHPKVTVSDATSKARYPGRGHDLGTLPVPPEEARDAALAALARYKDPKTRFAKLSLNPVGKEADLYPQMLGRKLGDRITVVRRPQLVGTAMTVQCRIEGIRHTFSGKDFRTEWALSPVDPTSYWILGSSALGSGTRLAS